MKQAFRSRIAVFIAALSLFSSLALIPQDLGGQLQDAQATSIDVADCVEYLKGRVGEYFPANHCLYFVRTAWQGMGAECSTACCASNYGLHHLWSSSMSDIPVGADVFFVNGSVHCDDCGRQAGHIGIYIGNGYMVHNYGSCIRCDKVADVATWGVLTYLGWGYHGGVTITGYADVKAQLAFNQSSYSQGDLVQIVWGAVSNAYEYELQIVNGRDEWLYDGIVKPFSSYKNDNFSPGGYYVRMVARNDYSSSYGDWYSFTVDSSLFKGFSVDKPSGTQPNLGKFTLLESSEGVAGNAASALAGSDYIFLCHLSDYASYKRALKIAGLGRAVLVPQPLNGASFGDATVEALKETASTSAFAFAPMSSALKNQLENIVGFGCAFQR